MNETLSKSLLIMYSTLFYEQWQIFGHEKYYFADLEVKVQFMFEILHLDLLLLTCFEAIFTVMISSPHTQCITHIIRINVGFMKISMLLIVFSVIISRRTKKKVYNSVDFGYKFSTTQIISTIYIAIPVAVMMIIHHQPPFPFTSTFEKKNKRILRIRLLYVQTIT